MRERSLQGPERVAAGEGDLALPWRGATGEPKAEKRMAADGACLLLSNLNIPTVNISNCSHHGQIWL